MNTSTRLRRRSRWSEQVEDECARQGLQLTPLRRRILSILGESAGPLGAYAIIEKLSKSEGKQIAPPTVYRTLDFFWKMASCTRSRAGMFLLAASTLVMFISACCCCARNAVEARNLRILRLTIS